MEKLSYEGDKTSSKNQNWGWRKGLKGGELNYHQQKGKMSVSQPTELLTLVARICSSLLLPINVNDAKKMLCRFTHKCTVP